MSDCIFWVASRRRSTHRHLLISELSFTSICGVLFSPTFRIQKQEFGGRRAEQWGCYTALYFAFYVDPCGSVANKTICLRQRLCALSGNSLVPCNEVFAWKATQLFSYSEGWDTYYCSLGLLMSTEPYTKNRQYVWASIYQVNDEESLSHYASFQFY